MAIAIAESLRPMPDKSCGRFHFYGKRFTRQ
jgi:hypothetical protein